MRTSFHTRPISVGGFMHFHLRVHHWVVWWFGIGAVCAIVALANILSRNLTRSQEDVVLVIGAIHWILGGLVCYSFEAIPIETPKRPSNETRSIPVKDE